MGVIQRLPDRLANKIAAGEVVGRPSSVVKELVENGIDAGATEIAVVIRNAGKSLILVRDNGSGMSAEDARVAFERHATSKISSAEDLDAITSLGFRGEALAAIGAVAQVELRTRTADVELGTLVRVENGLIDTVEPAAVEVGTMISVKNLFFSVPARRKFMKSNATEFKHCAETMQAFALAYPQVAFTFTDDESIIFSVESTTIEQRIAAVYSSEMLNALLPFEAEAEGVRVEGFIGRPNFARKSRADQFLFMNGRPIASKLLSHGVFSGYEHLLDKQSYPPYILFLTVDPERVDVNVHPAKSEVKFDDEQGIYALLAEGTRRTLSGYDLTPSMSMRDAATETASDVIAALRHKLPDADPATPFPGSGSGPRQDSTPSSRSPGSDAGSSSGREGDLFRELFIDPYDSPGSAEKSSTGLAAGTSTPNDFSSIPPPTDGDAPIASGHAPGQGVPQRPPVKESDDAERVGMWQVHNKYIITQIRSGIMIVDQHVAHERILYEAALATMETSLPMSQQLLFPLTLDLAPEEAALVRELRGDLSALGFEIAIKPTGRLTIHGVPIDVRSGQEESILRELLDQYREYQQMGKTDQREMLAAGFACRASIKAGDPLKESEMLGLIEQLFATTMPYVCPHGRPIVARIDLAELDRRFGRTS